MERVTYILLFFLFIPAVPVLGQTNTQDADMDIDVSSVQYEPVSRNYFAEYKYAGFIMDYYCSDGWSVTDRYTYEVVVIDSLLMVGFDSPETGAMHYISFQKKTIIPPDETDTLKNILGRAGLRQLKKGIPVPARSAYTKEVLIVKYAGINIAGGMFYYNMLQQDASAADINKMVAGQRSLTSSISGNYNSVIQALQSLFPQLGGLMAQAVALKR